ncbi:MAG: hypothetical protein PGN07_04620 [Aeromicrobium erythreum]
MTALSSADLAFLDRAIIDLYDAEVTRHPEGVDPEAVKEAIEPAVARLVASMHRGDSA